MTAEILFVLLVAFAPLLAISASIVGFFIYLGVIVRAARAAGRGRTGRTPAFKERS